MKNGYTVRPCLSWALSFSSTLICHAPHALRSYCHFRRNGYRKEKKKKHQTKPRGPKPGGKKLRKFAVCFKTGDVTRASLELTRHPFSACSLSLFGVDGDQQWFLMNERGISG
ncbi:hypothetical protein MPH_04396 [Macrophomina phaseolina MS6]|uniref:Uncharacterized protein n=1 Tax=Macrophomina phaseolina (strain MS6) TaxID=1126212 RepID=K2SNM8_MACPH|nr:hypothetical protein MPH_04396 [Macrophomina phaseolina MS6]